MGLIDRLVVVATKLVSLISTSFGFGAGETWPGEIALRVRPNIASSLARSLGDGVILIAGTNGKTTTTLMAKTILEHIGDTVVHNASGANLLNGIVSSFIRNSDWLGRNTADVGIFEVDENSLPVLLRYMVPKRLLLLNLFRDQLDRYGEVDVIAEKWEKAIKKLPKSTTVILNSDDPGVAAIARSVPGKALFFGLNKPKEFLKSPEHATDSTFCPNCGKRLIYDGIYYSHIGIWRCPSCKNKRPTPTIHSWPSPLPGLYNEYNTLAAVALAKSLDFSDAEIKKALHGFAPAFGRQEEIEVNGTRIKLFLSKNPAGFNASLRTVLEMGAKDLLIVLNDRIPDGRDVSWIWDVDFETIPPATRIVVSGDRVYDMAIRIKYAGRTAVVEPDLSQALAKAASGKLYVLATYSAMLEARKILKGKKIL